MSRSDNISPFNKASWAATILSIQPQMFPGPLGESLCGRALRKNLWALQCVDIRDFAEDKHRSVDDTPAGGGAGMVMRADVLARAIDKITTIDEEGRDSAGRKNPLFICRHAASL